MADPNSQAAGISLIKKGKKPSLTDAAKANELIKYENALLSATFTPQGCCKQTSSVGGVNYDFSGLINMLSSRQQHVAFDLEVVGDGVVRVYGGAVKSFLPSGMALGDSPPFTMTVSGSGVIYLALAYSISSSTITGLTIGAASSMPGDTSGNYHAMIGTYSTNDGALSVFKTIGGSQDFDLCGDVTPQWGLM